MQTLFGYIMLCAMLGLDNVSASPSMTRRRELIKFFKGKQWNINVSQISGNKQVALLREGNNNEDNSNID